MQHDARCKIFLDKPKQPPYTPPVEKQFLIKYQISKNQIKNNMNTRINNSLFNPMDVDFQKDLEILKEAKNYRNWLFSLIKPFLGTRIFEVGSAIGNYTEKLLDAELVVASDYEEKYVNMLERRFKKKSNVIIKLLDITSVDTYHQNELKSMNFDTAIALNVLEHIQDDEKCLKNMLDIICPGGRIILICPAYQSLYNCLDRSYGHFRRYNKKLFHQLASSIDAKIEVLSYFNPLGIIGWVINGNMLKRKTLPSRQTKLFDRIIPILQRIEKTVIQPFGLSILAVFNKDGIKE
jgi:2-polyprenyl-3-methyl-5-hydroxy-6-metoxy-1,4-benzoquinol methylase